MTSFDLAKYLIWDTWFGRGFLGFVIVYYLCYLPYLHITGKGHQDTWHFQLVLLIISLAGGKIIFWFWLAITLLNIDDTILWIGKKLK